MRRTTTISLTTVVIHGVLLVVSFVTQPLLAASAQTAWEAMLLDNPDLLEDSTLGPLEQAVLEVLTPEQYTDFVNGADAHSLVLTSGETLADFLLRQPSKGAVTGGLAYFPVPTCTVVRTPLSAAGKMATNEIRDFVVRGVGTDLSSQGGSATGCGVPIEAESIVATFLVQGPNGSGRLKAWAVDAPFPRGWLIDYKRTADKLKFLNSSVLDLCLAAGCANDFRVRTERAATHVRIEVLGYFEAGATSFDAISGGTNTSAAMVVGTGASLSATDGGTIEATTAASASDLGCVGCVAESELGFDTATQAELGSLTIGDVTPTTTKGDLLVENGANVVRLPVGTAGQVLVTDSAEPTGLRWATVISGPAIPAQVPRTGQTTCYDATGAVVTCGTGIGLAQDGHLQLGVTWPNPRFTKNGDGTVTDNLTGLIWLEDLDCAQETMDWASALAFANTLFDGSTDHNSLDCDLSDQSAVGAWRLPNVRAMQSLVHYGFYSASLPDTAGTGQWAEDDPFQGVQTSDVFYWTSTPQASGTDQVWVVGMARGVTTNSDGDIGTNLVWPVRGGQ